MKLVLHFNLFKVLFLIVSVNKKGKKENKERTKEREKRKKNWLEEFCKNEKTVLEEFWEM